jgi:hypothetical protein
MGKGVDPIGVGVDQRSVVVLPAGLVLLGSVVMVQTEQHRAGLHGGGTQVHGGLPTPRTDLHERGVLDGCTGPERGQEERFTFVVGHESPRRRRFGKELLATLGAITGTTGAWGGRNRA